MRARTSTYAQCPLTCRVGVSRIPNPESCVLTTCVYVWSLSLNNFDDFIKIINVCVYHDHDHQYYCVYVE